MAGVGSVLVVWNYVLLYAIAVLSAPVVGLQCLSNTNTPVDWFIAYKLPGNEKNVTDNSFFYMDAEKPSWKPSIKTMESPGQAIAYTLNQIYKPKDKETFDSIVYGMYNDQLPKNITRHNFTHDPPYKHVTLEYGHTKGAFAFDEKTGFWLVHSTPRFPPIRSLGYQWPPSATRNAQSFLCISMGTSANLNEIGKQFQFSFPKFYDHRLSSWTSAYPDLVSAIDGKKTTSPPWQRKKTLTSLKGVVFSSFAKAKNFSADLYSDWLAPTFKAPLLVETWQNGPNKMCSNCSGTYKVFNIANIAFDSEKVKVDFKETKDHAKWAVTNSTSTKWTCIGGINRQMSQIYRPGGTVCFRDPHVWSSFHSIISKVHGCEPYRDCVMPNL